MSIYITIIILAFILAIIMPICIFIANRMKRKSNTDVMVSYVMEGIELLKKHSNANAKGNSKILDTPFHTSIEGGIKRLKESNFKLL